jgi:hypothetical protein
MSDHIDKVIKGKSNQTFTGRKAIICISGQTLTGEKWSIAETVVHRKKSNV